MTDPKDSMSLSSVSRRRLIASVAVTPMSVTASFFPRSPEPPETIVPLWRNWQRLHAIASELCHRWQEMESRLVHAVGFPQVFIPAPDSARDICAQSHSDIDQAVAAGDCSQELGAALHAELAARRERWDAEAEALGFDEANRQELAAWREEEEAVRAIFRTGAASLAGVEIKLALMIQLCAAFSDDPDFPLPQLRSTLDDVKRLRRALDALRC